MGKVARITLALCRDEGGASFLEYSYLLGILLSISLAVLVAVSVWAGGMWNALCAMMTALPGMSIEACSSG